MPCAYLDTDSLGLGRPSDRATGGTKPFEAPTSEGNESAAATAAASVFRQPRLPGRPRGPTLFPGSPEMAPQRASPRRPASRPPGPRPRPRTRRIFREVRPSERSGSARRFPETAKSARKVDFGRGCRRARTARLARGGFAVCSLDGSGGNVDKKCGLLSGGRTQFSRSGKQTAHGRIDLGRTVVGRRTHSLSLPNFD